MLGLITTGAGIPALVAKGTWEWVRGASRTSGRFYRRRPVGAVAGTIILLIVLMAIFANFVSPYDPLDVDPLNAQTPPNSSHWMGRDEIGRDVLSRVIHGSRISMSVGLLAVLIGTTLGAVWGLASGYLRRGFDMATQRVVEVWMSFPDIVLAMALLVVLGKGFIPVVIAVAFTRLPYSVRVIRSVALSVREYQYIDAARAIGASDLRIMVRHILPNCIAPFLILASAHIGTAIIIEATLGFLGIGIPPPAPSWGNMLGSAVTRQLNPMWWLVVFPGVAITLVVLCFNLFGDAIRDVLDPRLRGR